MTKKAPMRNCRLMRKNKRDRNSKRLALGLASFFIFYAGIFPAFADDEKASAPASDIYNKAVRCYEKGKWGAAKEYLHEYLAEYSDSPLYITCLYYLGYCYQQLKDIPEAISIYHKVADEARGGDAFWAEKAENRIEELI